MTFCQLIDHGEDVSDGLVGHDPAPGQDFEPLLADQLLEEEQTEAF
jgi:hypothetical protein